MKYARLLPGLKSLDVIQTPTYAMVTVTIADGTTQTIGIDPKNMQQFMVRAMDHTTPHTFDDLNDDATVISERLEVIPMGHVRKHGTPCRINLEFGCGFMLQGPFFLHSGVTVGLDHEAGAADLLADIEVPWPFADASLDGIYSAHCVEHLSVVGAAVVFREAYRTLKPGGLFRCHLPDAGYWASEYHQEGLTDRVHTNIMGSQEGMYQFHRSLWDGPRMAEKLHAAGFTEVVTGVGRTPDELHGWAVKGGT